MRYKSLKQALDYWNVMPNSLNEKQEKYLGIIFKAAGIYEGILKREAAKIKRNRKKSAAREVK